MNDCPYQYPCGKKPCEMNEVCPAKKPAVIPTIVPYIPSTTPYTPSYPWGSPIIWCQGTITKTTGD